MAELPHFLKPFLEEGRSLFHKKAVSEVEFSSGTYQLHVLDPKESSPWVFVQLGPSGRLRDRFCGCESYDEHGACKHIAAAYMRIYDPGPIPLHQVYESSFWVALGRVLFEKYGDNKPEGNGDLYVLGETLKIKAKTAAAKDFFKTLFLEEREETEENSLKFSNLTPEDLELWRDGEPTKELQYELSVWSDLAKLCFMIQQEGGKTEIDLNGDCSPFKFSAIAKGIEIVELLSESSLEPLLPVWDTVSSKLSASHTLQGNVKKVEYDVGQCQFIITRASCHSFKENGLAEGIAIGDWEYLPKLGFRHLSEGQKNETEIIEPALIEHFLTYRARKLKNKFQDIKVFENVVEIKYALKFDREFNLHIEAFVEKKGDLTHPDAKFLPNWLFLPGVGFYPHENLPFQDIKTIIPSDKVGHFISTERAFLADKKGFETHEMQLETLMMYEVDAFKALKFQSLLARSIDNSNAFDFGPWIYIPKDGFYKKSEGFSSGQVTPGMQVKRDSVGLFIHANEEELTHIPNFFVDTPIVIASGLRAEITADGSIFIELHHDFCPEYDPKSLFFYDDYIYAEGKGFSKLPIDPRIPERFHHPHNIPAKQFDQFVEHLLPSLLPHFFELDSKLRKPKSLDLTVTALEKEEQSYYIQLCYKSPRGVVDARTIFEAIKKRRRYLATESGLIDLFDERYQWMSYLTDKARGTRQRGMLLTPLDMMRMNAYDELNVEGDEELKRAFSSLFDQESTLADLSEFEATLRPYQETGVKWLWNLFKQGLSGLLCDDMGLGKTLQAMALMAGASRASEKHTHFLVVCPTSVIYHWQDKIHQFWPDCKVFTFYGSDRSMEGFHGEYDLLLTSYGIYRREQKVLSKTEFEIAIFDEVQLAKNKRSKLHQAVKTTNAKSRIGLTGTPIENYLSELKALFDLVLPGYLPNQSRFRDFFQIPIERQGNTHRKELLTKMIDPFILRRKKEDVLTDLPEKIEEVTHCALIGDQHALYEETLRKERRQILSQLEDPDEKVPYLHVFTLLMRLKQICNHPAVYFKEPANFHAYQSGKWERFKEIIEETQEVGQKVVVFSQYLMQLDIIEAYLTEKGIGYAGIRGSTSKREEQIKRFHNNPECKVFVASLQAAGLGIDLTAASVVIHYDRWWNAAKENQATDRVHRIGQTRGVQVFKLMTRGTIEERIDEIIEKKAKLLDDIVRVDDKEVVKLLSRTEIRALLRDVEFTQEDQTTLIDD